MVVLPFVLRVVVVQCHAQVGAVVGGVGTAPEHTMHRVDGAAVDAAVCGGLALVQAAQQNVQKGQVIAQAEPSPQPVQSVDAAAQSAVGRAVAALRFRAEAGPIRDHISKHGGSALFDELGAAARAGDLDAPASPGHAQLLAALGAAVVVVQLAVGPLLLQAAEPIAEPILQAVKAVVLLGALGDVAAQAAVVAQNQQCRAQPCEQGNAGKQRHQQHHDGTHAQKLVQAIGAVAPDHELTEFFSHRFSHPLLWGFTHGNAGQQRRPAEYFVPLEYQPTMIKF